MDRRTYLRTLVGTIGGGASLVQGATASRFSQEAREWAFEAGGPVNAKPTVVSGTVYVGNNSSTLYAVDAATGDQQWGVRAQGSFNNAPAVVDGTVYVGNGDGNLYALDGATGDQQWAFETGGFVDTSPVVADGTVYIGSDDHNLYAVDAASGTQEWVLQRDSNVFYSPVVSNGVIYAGHSDGMLYALDAATGSEAWTVEVGGTVKSQPTVAGGTVYAGSGYSTVYALDADDGTEQWTFETEGSYENVTSPAVVDGTVYVGSWDGNLYALDASSGAEQWAFETGDKVRSSPAVAAGTVYVGSNDGHLYAVEAASGEEQWAALTAAPVKSSPTVSGSTVYFGTIDDRLFAVPTTGPTEPLTPTPTPEPERTPTPEQTPTGTPTETATEVPTATPREANDEETESGPNAGTVAEGGQTPAGAAGVDADDGGQALSLPGDVPMAPAVGATLLGSVALGAIGQRLRDDEDDSNDTSARESSDPGGPASADNGSEAGGSAPTTTESGSPGSEAAAGRSKPTATGGGGRSADGPTRSLQRGDPSDRPSSVPTPPALRLSYLDLDRGDRIGTGGNADVYRATASGPDGPVDLAIKEPRVEGTLHAETVERVVQEAETWADLDDHDHIVGVVDWGSEPLPWIAMEHMDAGHLGDWLAGDPSLVERLWVGYGVVKGVRHAHRHGVAHLDLKPENVLFRSTGAGTWPVPKIADWGLSKHLLDHSNSVEGLTPAYAAPEQFDGDRGPTDNVTDVYQLGAVLYELFTGQPPFEGPSSQVMHDILHEDPAPPGEHVQLPPAVDEMILRALATERTERYDSVLYLRDDIQEIVQSL